MKFGKKIIAFGLIVAATTAMAVANHEQDASGTVRMFYPAVLDNGTTSPRTASQIQGPFRIRYDGDTFRFVGFGSASTVNLSNRFQFYLNDTNVTNNILAAFQSLNGVPADPDDNTSLYVVSRSGRALAIGTGIWADANAPQ